LTSRTSPTYTVRLILTQVFRAVKRGGEAVFFTGAWTSKGARESEIYTETLINARSHFEKTYQSETSMKITTNFKFILRRIDINLKIYQKK
jgi:hypothetical protein